MNELLYLLTGKPHPCPYNNFVFDTVSVERKTDKRKEYKNIGKIAKKLADEKLKKTEDAIVEFLSNGPKTSLNIRGYLGYSKGYTNRRLVDMKDKGLIRRIRITKVSLWENVNATSL